MSRLCDSDSATSQANAYAPSHAPGHCREPRPSGRARLRDRHPTRRRSNCGRVPPHATPRPAPSIRSTGRIRFPRVLRMLDLLRTEPRRDRVRCDHEHECVRAFDRSLQGEREDLAGLDPLGVQPDGLAAPLKRRRETLDEDGVATRIGMKASSHSRTFGHPRKWPNSQSDRQSSGIGTDDHPLAGQLVDPCQISTATEASGVPPVARRNGSSASSLYPRTQSQASFYFDPRCATQSRRSGRGLAAHFVGSARDGTAAVVSPAVTSPTHAAPSGSGREPGGPAGRAGRRVRPGPSSPRHSGPWIADRLVPPGRGSSPTVATTLPPTDPGGH